jgi:tRNA (cytidine/uridine-2'-O-)-methyltransferase
LGLSLHVIHPIGFSMDEKAVRRAGLDYWKHVDVTEHADFEAFLEWKGERRMVLYSTHGTRPYTAVSYEPGHVLLFGRESTGLPREMVAQYGAAQIPMTGPVRSLNLSNAVAIATYGAMQQVKPELFT